ncbi:MULTISPECIES: SRPBCC domain-containing protein [unclassified Arenibacter]|uniref:SRPBCC family protein n=1 Tax=unclassified Arenibacter TaxID=2615047 RepID=UPI000E34755B|nr:MULTISPECIES: SRPBCC domain-containing protein [unclassified Arenibacter]MCM4164633.1 SRPBCC domain-containing protein [Arenibacter sp. A80]RFT55714.1 SRPBCC domain-containing protein [Arenibacter sp. P308M17]
MADIIHRVGIKAPVSEVYRALASIEGIADWWTQNTSGTSAVGKTIGVRFHSKEGKEVGSMDMLVEALEPNKKVHWHFTAGPEEWIGTDVIFQLHEEEDYTTVLFGHRNWREAVEFTAHCSMKWAIFLLSLKELVETGKGKPSPHDIKIDNWN